MNPELYAVAERLLASGRYDTVSEIMRAALRLLEERETGFLEHRAVRRAETACGATP